MKYIVVLSCLVLSFSTLADERFAGEWNWSGNECRDAQLSEGSRYSVSSSHINVDGDVSSAEIIMDSTNNVTFRYNAGGEIMEERGTYTVSDNEVNAGNSTGGFRGLLMNNDNNDWLIVTMRDEDDDHNDDWDDICHSDDEIFVFVFGRTDQ